MLRYQHQRCFSEENGPVPVEKARVIRPRVRMQSRSSRMESPHLSQEIVVAALILSFIAAAFGAAAFSEAGASASAAAVGAYFANSQNPLCKWGVSKSGWEGALLFFLLAGFSCTKRASVILQRPKTLNHKTRFPPPYETYMRKRGFSELPITQSQTTRIGCLRYLSQLGFL